MYLPGCHAPGHSFCIAFCFGDEHGGGGKHEQREVALLNEVLTCTWLWYNQNCIQCWESQAVELPGTTARFYLAYMRGTMSQTHGLTFQPPNNLPDPRLPLFLPSLKHHRRC